MATTFDFGKGRVPAHKHPNGGGWVADTATVAETVTVGDKARVYDYATIDGTVRVTSKARVCHQAVIYGSCSIRGNALVRGTARVFGHADIWGAANIDGNPRICGIAEISGNAVISGDAFILQGWYFGNVQVTKTPTVISNGIYQVVMTPDWVICGTLSLPIREWIKLRDSEILKQAGPLYKILINYLEEFI